MDLSTVDVFTSISLQQKSITIQELQSRLIILAKSDGRARYWLKLWVLMIHVLLAFLTF